MMMVIILSILMISNLFGDDYHHLLMLMMNLFLLPPPSSPYTETPLSLHLFHPRKLFCPSCSLADTFKINDASGVIQRRIYNLKPALQVFNKNTTW